ncbi:TetR/AcrR family transcriptional regulator [Ilumatobacter nonamiensis]|uniref:TetR/AcrR family transcriptional regulator n=1 Tax=Ilumatobacter nonamiensis TaxID=467093 RepID=UPI00034D31F2|nr:TetR/AcrR family transcriptional regulator [Ilumatobacter nonamiensis]
MTNLLQPPTGEDAVPNFLSEDAPVTTSGDKADGRSLRRQRNRDAVIRSLIELIREGDLTPTVGQIADRAELSHRSVFRYFDDLNDLARTAIETEFREAWPLSRVEDVGMGSLDERIDRIVEAQLRTLERTHLLGLVARARAPEIDEVERGLKYIFDLHLDQVREQFAPELNVMGDDKATAIASAVAVMTWLDSYDLLRRTAGSTDAEIAAMWRTALQSLLS